MTEDDAPFDERAVALRILGDRRIYIDDDGRIAEPEEQWADGTDRLPNRHTNWYLLVGEPNPADEDE